MPPKFKFSKEQIITTAMQIVREEGIDALTARSLATALGCSPKPIFGLFCGMSEVKDAVLLGAEAIYSDYIAKDMAEGKYPPYKASGMAYIRFASEEKQLFRLLFMRDRSGEHIGEDRESIRDILEIIMKNTGLDEDRAYLLHLEMWVFVHGIATMHATAYLEWDTEFASRVLSDAYMGIKARFCEEKVND